MTPLDLIQQRIAEHRQRISAGRSLLRDLAAQEAEIAQELQQREGAVLALLEIEQILAGQKDQPLPEPEAV